MPPPFIETRYFRWTPDSKALIYIAFENGVGNLRRLPIDGSPSVNMTSFTDPLAIYSFALTADGKKLAVARGVTTTDIVLVKNVR